MGVVAIAGANVYLEVGLINANLIAGVIPGIMIGALIGSKLLIYFTNDVVRRIFFVLLIGLGLEMIFTGIRGMM